MNVKNYKTMKKSVYCFALSMLAVLSTPRVYAQTDMDIEQAGMTSASTSFYLGVRGIPQLSWMVNKDDIDNSSYETQTKFGAGFGLAGGYNFTDHSGVELDALYSIEGKKYKLGGTEYNQKLNYLKVPLMFTYATAPATFRFIGKIGPQINILSVAEINPALVNGTKITDNKDAYNDFVFGAVASAGARYAITDMLSLEALLRYDISFTKVENDSYKLFPAGRSNTYNMTAGLEIGLNYLIQ